MTDEVTEEQTTLESMKEKGAEGGDTFAPAWKPKEDGDQLAGKLTRIEMTNTINGDAHVVGITDEKGKAWSLWLGKVLLNKFLDAAPGIDALVVVTYKGQEKSKAGFTYNSYDMQCEPKGDFTVWMEARELFNQKQALLEDAARQGAGIAPDSQEGLAKPF